MPPLASRHLAMHNVPPLPNLSGAAAHPAPPFWCPAPPFWCPAPPFWCLTGAAARHLPPFWSRLLAIAPSPSAFFLVPPPRHRPRCRRLVATSHTLWLSCLLPVACFPTRAAHQCAVVSEQPRHSVWAVGPHTFLLPTSAALFSISAAHSLCPLPTHWTSLPSLLGATHCLLSLAPRHVAPSGWLGGGVAKRPTDGWDGGLPSEYVRWGEHKGWARWMRG